MPSFTRRVPTGSGAQASAPGAATVSGPSSSQRSVAPRPLPTLISTGIPSLNDLLHLPPSTLSLFLSGDVHSSWPRLLARYFAAQGLLAFGGAGEEVIIVADEEAGREFISGAMWVDERRSGAGAGEDSASETEGVGGDGGEETRGKIAWRYGGMDKFKTSVGEKGQLNLSTTIPKSILASAEKSGALHFLPLQTSSASSSSSTSTSSASWGLMAGVLARLGEKLGEGVGGGTRRVIIPDFAGVEWESPTPAEIHRFLHSLKYLVRGKNAVVCITLPPALVRDLGEDGVKRLSWVVDACVELKGFADDPTLQPIFNPLHGLLTLHTFPQTQALLPATIKHSTLLGLASGSENNLGFRARRKRWGVETVHLGVEGGVGERRTEPSASAAIAIPGEGVERVSRAVPEAEGPPPAQGKVKKPRARVMFADEEEVLGPTPASGEGTHTHTHAHDHTHASPSAVAGTAGKIAPRVELRHDRPDLYEF